MCHSKLASKVHSWCPPTEAHWTISSVFAPRCATPAATMRFINQTINATKVSLPDAAATKFDVLFCLMLAFKGQILAPQGGCPNQTEWWRKDAGVCTCLRPTFALVAKNLSASASFSTSMYKKYLPTTSTPATLTDDKLSQRQLAWLFFGMCGCLQAPLHASALVSAKSFEAEIASPDGCPSLSSTNRCSLRSLS